MSQLADIHRLFEGTIERFDKLDILVNNAGTGLSKPLLETTEEKFDRLILWSYTPKAFYGGSMPDSIKVFTHSTDGIQWHVEQRGTGAHVVLIPSGEGDCASYDKVAADLASDFTVTTFDTPGFSRTTVSAPELISQTALTGQIATLVRSLGIERATFYGCSSGGMATLDLAADYTDIVEVAIVHEAALADPNEETSPLQKLMAMDDASVFAACARMYADFMNEDKAAWEALGPEYHARLTTNYVTWVRRYLAAKQHAPFDPAVLANKPIVWTIGSLTQVMHFFSNISLAHQAGIEIGMLHSKHFPQVSIPAALAAHIRAAARQT